MKTFQRFKQDINEAVPLAIPAGIALKTGLGSLLGSSALKAAGAGALTGGALTGSYFASKKASDMSDDEISKKGVDPVNVGKNTKSKRKKFKNAVKEIIRDVKAGLSVDPKDVTAKKYNPNAEFVRKEMEKRAEEGDSYAKRWMENMKRNRNMPNDK